MHNVGGTPKNNIGELVPTKTAEAAQDVVAQQMHKTGGSAQPQSTGHGQTTQGPGQGAEAAKGLNGGLAAFQPAGTHAPFTLAKGRKVGWGAALPSNPDVIATIERRVAQDRVDFQKCVKSFHHLAAPENQAAVVSGCASMRTGFSKMFEDEAVFKEVWADFQQSQHCKDCKGDLEKEPNFKLSERGYHNIGHAKEMYADTYAKLKDFPFAIRQAGATMAYFHDLVQGLDPFPNEGRNENVTAKLMMHLIDTTMGPSDVREALKDLCNATIVGGTFLIDTVGDEGPKKQTPSEAVAVDHTQFSHSEAPSVQALMKITKTMAENDISRTKDKNSYLELIPNDDNDPVIATRNDAITARRKAVSQDPICQILQSEEGGHVEEHMLGRMFQSVRMQQEFNCKNLDKSVLVKQLEAFIQHKEAQVSPEFTALLAKIKNKITWESEGKFALPSGHEEYSNMLKNEGVTNTLTGASDPEVAGFILLALTKGQDGSHMTLDA